MERILKITLAILLFACLLPMPYSYYQLVRFVAMGVFAFLAFQAYQEKNETGVIIYVLLALLFQPFVKVALGREVWNIVDVIVGIYLLLSAIGRRKITK